MIVRDSKTIVSPLSCTGSRSARYRRAGGATVLGEPSVSRPSEGFSSVVGVERLASGFDDDLFGAADFFLGGGVVVALVRVGEGSGSAPIVKLKVSRPN